MEKIQQGSQTFCFNCGTPIEEGLAFCPKCGAKIQAPEIPTAPASQTPQQNQTQYAAFQPQMQTAYQGQTPPAKKSKRNIAIVAVIVVVAVAIMMIIAAAAISSGRNTNGGGGGLFSPAPAPDIRYVSATFSQGTFSGDLTVNADITNLGNAIGTSTITIYVHENSGTFSNSASVTLAPSQTKTVSITVNTPFGTGISSDMFDIYIDGSKVA
jgi:flagellar basal body-associated protein FliL